MSEDNSSDQEKIGELIKRWDGQTVSMHDLERHAMGLRQKVQYAEADKVELSKEAERLRAQSAKAAETIARQREEIVRLEAEIARLKSKESKGE